MSNIIVRYVQPIDVSKLVPLIEGYLHFYNRPVPSIEKIEEMIIHFLNKPDEGIQMVAVKDDKLIGFFTLNFIWSTTRMEKIAFLNDLFVDPGHRNKGAGEALLKKAIEFSEKEKYPLIRLLTAQDNYPAQSLYTKTGGKAPGWKVYEYEI